VIPAGIFFFAAMHMPGQGILFHTTMHFKAKINIDMKIHKSARISAVFLLTLMVAVIMGCSKKKERVYELLPPDPETDKDLTELAIKMSVNIENRDGADAGEGSKKVIDGNLDTKFLIFSFAPDFYIELEYDIAQRLDAYTLTSANDASDRDPKNWKIVGSNDRTQWTELDSQTDQQFSERKQTQRFEFDNENTYKYYRINISALRGATSALFQLAEWRVIRRPQN
jgi:hypothetical protein